MIVCACVCVCELYCMLSITHPMLCLLGAVDDPEQRGAHCRHVRVVQIPGRHGQVGMPSSMSCICIFTLFVFITILVLIPTLMLLAITLHMAVTITIAINVPITTITLPYHY
ncbi:hypothetical protein EON63_02400 [archaeon]|nr:MAG: hypothetical protein EON63_02400 [archaeon]